MVFSAAAGHTQLNEHDRLSSSSAQATSTSMRMFVKRTGNFNFDAHVQTFAAKRTGN